MPTITVIPENKRIEYAPGQSLMDILLGAGVYVDNACGGMGLCGKCRVRIAETGAVAGTGKAADDGPTEAAANPGERSGAGKEQSALLEPGSDERRVLAAQGITDSAVRLSCLVYPQGDLTVEPLQQEGRHEVLSEGYVPDFDFDVPVRKVLLQIEKPSIDDQRPFEDQVLEQTGAQRIHPAALLQRTYETGVWTAALRGEEVIALEAGDTTRELYGVGIDIGTTTVVCALVDLLTGEEIGTAAQINAQKHFGLDVLTRISYEMEHPADGVRRLQEAIVSSINEMVASVCREHGVSCTQVYEIAVAANCTMLHALLGVDAVPIGKAPFAPIFTRGRELEAGQIGLGGSTGARLYCLPSVSAYIGADIVAGAYVCELKKASGNVMFIDIGTNGEIVLASHGRLLSCSCAAGPALEGMNISAGMRAAEGAIEDVEITEDGLRLQTIGDAAPQGICGSGILTVTKELLRTGIVRKTGAFVKAGKFPPEDYRARYIAVDEAGKRSFVMNESPRLAITQGDIRQVQLAKGAILSGFVALLERAGIGMEDLDRVLIAGQFGAHLPAASITGTGILPFEVEEKIEYVGNTSKTGAYMALLSARVRREMEELAGEMEYLELGATENYERLLSECLIFPTF